MFPSIWTCFFSPVDIEDTNSRLLAMVSMLRSCPKPNHHTFLYLLHHLQRSESTTHFLSYFIICCKSWSSKTFMKIIQCVRIYFLFRVSEKQNINKMSPMNLATVFGPSLLRLPVVGLGNDGFSVDISQEVVVQVGFFFSSIFCISWFIKTDVTNSYLKSIIIKVAPAKTHLFLDTLWHIIL